jgi:hypothetical protein
LVRRHREPAKLWIAVAAPVAGTIWHSLFGWLVADSWCWFVLREEYCWLC